MKNELPADGVGHGGLADESHVIAKRPRHAEGMYERKLRPRHGAAGLRAAPPELNLRRGARQELTPLTSLRRR